MDERNNMIDVTQYMLFESSGDSDFKSDLNKTGSSPFSSCRGGGWFFGSSDQFQFRNNYDDDAESCSYDSSYGECVDGFSRDCRDLKGFHVNKHEEDDEDDQDDDYCSDGNDEIEEDREDEDAIDSKMVDRKSKNNSLCTDFVMGTRQLQKRSKDCSTMEFLNQKETADKNFWDTCLAS